jgi:RND family efflux transporter MFP subunit
MGYKHFITTLFIFSLIPFSIADNVQKENIFMKKLNELASKGYFDKRIEIVLQPYEKVTISSIVDTTVLKHNFKVGSTFNKGDILMVLDDSLYLQEYLKTKDVANFYKNAYADTMELTKHGGTSDFELAKSKMEMTVSQVSYEKAKINYEACKIKAPFNGRVIEKKILEHEFVKTSAPMLLIINDSSLLAVMHFPSQLQKYINTKDTFTFHIDETNTNCFGKIYTTSGVIDSVSRTFEVKVLINNKERKYLTGMSGTLISVNANN